MRIESWSPDSRYQLLLEVAGEIRFGPSYYHARIVEKAGRQVDLGERFFGDMNLWSDDSRYLVLQEWASTSESEGPRTQLLALDMVRGLGHRVTPVMSGWVEARCFEGNVVQIDRHRREGSLHTVVDLSVVTEWEPLLFSSSAE